MPSVFINTSASDTGRLEVGTISWSNTMIVLEPISKYGLAGNTFYFKVVLDNLEESNWFGPLTINNLVAENVTFHVELSDTNNISAVTSSVIEFGYIFEIETQSDIEYNEIIEFTQLNSEETEPDVVGSIYEELSLSTIFSDEINEALVTILGVEFNTTLSEFITSASFTGNKRVYINSSAIDSGRLEHEYISWSNDQIILGPINLENLTGSSFYFKVEPEQGLESDWFGPVQINQDFIESVVLNIQLQHASTENVDSSEPNVYNESVFFNTVLQEEKSNVISALENIQFNTELLKSNASNVQLPEPGVYNENITFALINSKQINLQQNLNTVIPINIRLRDFRDVSGSVRPIHVKSKKIILEIAA